MKTKQYSIAQMKEQVTYKPTFLQKNKTFMSLCTFSFHLKVLRSSILISQYSHRWVFAGGLVPEPVGDTKIHEYSKSHNEPSISIFLHRVIQPTMDRVILHIFNEKNPCVSGTVQFRPLLFKSKL